MWKRALVLAPNFGIDIKTQYFFLGAALAFRIRSIHIKLLSCIIIAGSASLFTIIPIPLPREVTFITALGLAMFLITRYTEADLFPDALLIPLVVELISAFLLNDVISPMFQ